MVRAELADRTVPSVTVWSMSVTDAAPIPGSTGACNPSWTIAALVERCLDQIVAVDVGPVL